MLTQTWKTFQEMKAQCSSIVSQMAVFCVLIDMLKNSYKMYQHPPLFCLFWSFQTKNKIFITNQCEKMSKCPSSIGLQDSIPWPFKHELSPITTRPGLLKLLSDYPTTGRCLRKPTCCFNTRFLNDIFHATDMTWNHSSLTSRQLNPCKLSRQCNAM